MHLLASMLIACASPPTETAAPDPIEQAVARIRADEPPCLAKFSRVDVWRTAEGAVHRLFYQGDVTACSHPPSVWYDAMGTRLEVVAFEPITDDNRAHYDAIWERHTTGASKSSETVFVLGVPKLE